MPGALAAAVTAGAVPPAPASAPPPAAGKAGADSFLEALGLNQPPPAAEPEAKAQPAAAPEDKKAAAAAGDDKPATPAANPELAWLLNLIGISEPAPAGQGGATAETAAYGADGARAAAKNAAPPAAAVAAGATAAAPVPAAAADPAALAADAAAAGTAAPLPAAALAHDKTSSAAATAAAEAPAPAVTAAAAATVPQAPLAAPPHSFAGLLAQTPPAAPAAAPHAALPQDSSVWPAALHEHVRWQLDELVQEARLELHPRELGSVQVQLRIGPHGAEVQFAAAHPQARQALEASLPQLRALLAADGLYLAQANVGSQARSQQQPAPSGRSRFTLAGDAAGADAAPEPRRRIARIGLVDAFA